jgi:hypothetical protein
VNPHNLLKASVSELHRQGNGADRCAEVTPFDEIEMSRRFAPEAARDMLSRVKSLGVTNLMSANETAAPAARTFMAATILIALAAASAFTIWLMVAMPVLSGEKAPAHADHYAYVFAHAFGGTLMLFAGALALYVGWTRRLFRFHRWIGATYLIGGALGAGMGLYLSITEPHPLPGVGVATGTLAVAWLAIAAMAWRAAINRRFDSHRDWMIRSYVLTWTFVFCRIVMLHPASATAAPSTIVAIIWASWITPLIACEIALQWNRGARNT